MNVTQILEKLITLNTIEDKENQAIIKWLADFLSPLGFKIQFVKDKETKKINLLAKYNKKKPVLTFSGHTDTVPAGANWTKEPFKLTSEGDNLYGLGSCDMKGGIAAILAAVSQTDLASLKKGLNLLFTYDEEIKFRGIINFLRKVKLKSKYVIIAEPTNLAPQAAAKGVVSLKIDFWGKEAHGSSPEQGINAILLASDFIKKLQQYFVSLKKQKNEIFPIPWATLNIAKISGGDAINKVPAKCSLELEYRTINNSQGYKIYQQILQILRQSQIKYKIKMTLQTPPLLGCNPQFIKGVEELTGTKSFGTNFSNEGSYFCQAGYDCLVLGPGNDMAHQADEYVSVKQLEQAVEIYKAIIRKFCT